MSPLTTHNQQVPEISRTYLVIAAYYSDVWYLPSLDKSNERPVVYPKHHCWSFSQSVWRPFIASWTALKFCSRLASRWNSWMMMMMIIGACSSVICALDDDHDVSDLLAIQFLQQNWRRSDSLGRFLFQ